MNNKNFTFKNWQNIAAAKAANDFELLSNLVGDDSIEEFCRLDVECIEGFQVDPWESSEHRDTVIIHFRGTPVGVQWPLHVRICSGGGFDIYNPATVHIIYWRDGSYTVRVYNYKGGI